MTLAGMTLTKIAGHTWRVRVLLVASSALAVLLLDACNTQLSIDQGTYMCSSDDDCLAGHKCLLLADGRSACSSPTRGVDAGLADAGDVDADPARDAAPDTSPDVPEADAGPDAGACRVEREALVSDSSCSLLCQDCREAGASCQWIGSKQRCAPAGDAHVGEACDQSSNPCGVGLICVTLGDAGSKCQQVCRVGSNLSPPTACPAGFECRSLANNDDIGICRSQ